MILLFFIFLFPIISGDSSCSSESIAPNPSDCSSFIQCDHGNEIVRPCPSGLYFNPQISSCDWPQNVECGNDLSTTIGSTLSTSTSTSTSNPSTLTTPSVNSTENVVSSTTGVSTSSTTMKPLTSTTPKSTTPSTSVPNLSKGPIKFAPYFDVNLDGPKLTDIAAATGQKDFVLAFALGSSEGCVPKWGGQNALNDPKIINPIRALQSQGGRFIAATGGAAGPYFEQLCSSVDSLASAYKQVLDAVVTNELDVDIESTVDADRVNQALAKVQAERPSTFVSYTLMVQAEDYGLTPILGVDILKNAKKNGVRVDFVNPMTMEFGGPSLDYGDQIIGAATSTVGQMKTIWPEKSEAQLYAMLSVTPMLGKNFNGKSFTQAHAKKLVAWGKSKGVGRLHFWSVGRDHGSCAGGGISPTCSSIAQSEYEFTKIFQGF